MKRALLVVGAIVLVAASSAALLYAAWALEESRKAVRTIVVKNPEGEDAFVVELKEREGEDLIVHCTEDHFQDAFGHFARFLGIDSPPIDAPGGVMLLGRVPEDVPEALRPAKRTLVEVLKRHSPRRVVLVAHSECLLYDAIAAWQDDLDAVKGRQELDLIQARKVIRSWFPKAQVEVYYAMKKDGRLAFNPLMLEEKR